MKSIASSRCARHPRPVPAAPALVRAAGAGRQDPPSGRQSLPYPPWPHSHSRWAEHGGRQVAPHNPLISDLILENRPVEVVHRRRAEVGQPGRHPVEPARRSPACRSWPQGSTPRSTRSACSSTSCRSGARLRRLHLAAARAGRGRACTSSRASCGCAASPAPSAAIAYAFSGFYIVSVNFTMIIAAAAWLPLILAVIEIVVAQAGARRAGGRLRRRCPYVVARRGLPGDRRSSPATSRSRTTR